MKKNRAENVQRETYIIEVTMHLVASNAVLGRWLINIKRPSTHGVKEMRALQEHEKAIAKLRSFLRSRSKDPCALELTNHLSHASLKNITTVSSRPLNINTVAIITERPVSVIAQGG